jgi:hypothetical protein
MVDGDLIFQPRSLHIVRDIQTFLPESKAEQVARLLNRFEGPPAMNHAHSKTGAQEGPAALTPLNLPVTERRSQKPDVIPAVVVDQQQPATGNEQRLRGR